ncbi:MAG: polyprenyl synthetase family protein [Dehalococcoidia bacterium]|nr:polyprenyl synthetase family protein [Dehalococcoidia bacterium]
MQRKMELNQVYALAQPGLSEVETTFAQLIDSQEEFPEMQKMLRQVLVGGKVMRPMLTLLAGMFYDYDLKVLQPMAASTELMHIATLVHDDAIDSADCRRGRPTINAVWGVDLAILAGDFLFARAGEMAARTGSIRVVELFSQTLGIIARGEVKQALASFKLDQTFEQYIERVAAKTAALFTLSTVSGGILSHAPENSVRILHDYGYNLGIAFQIVDDILDFVGNAKDVGKPVGADLAQGTVTLPAQKLLQRYPKDNPLMAIARKEDLDNNIKKVIEMVRNSDIIDECYKLAEDYCCLACRDLMKLPAKPPSEALMTLVDYVIKRNK